MGNEEITTLLQGWKNGSEGAYERLFPLVYEELRRRARGYMRGEREGHTIQATALVHEAYMRLIGDAGVDWQDRNHFFALAATAMRRILVDHARSRLREKRGGGALAVTLDKAEGIIDGKTEELLRLDEALVELSQFDPRQAQIVELKYFGGMTNEEIAAEVGVSVGTVKRDWMMARAWLYGYVREGNG
ncbi:MAG: sigma-70 family RNA polymerase sigma factor [Pyrinomonadaceae bacterium]